MTKSFIFYTLSWGFACLIAIFLMFCHRKAVELLQSRYWRYLLQNWKISTFLLAASGLILISPYTGDHTWDYFDASFMAILTYTTAPWAIGTLYLAIRGKTKAMEVYIAMCIWMFSASWSYDLYLILRDGDYPDTWLPNIFASSVLYVSAGLLWNLQWKEGRGVVFGFMEPNWLEVTDNSGFRKVGWFALPFMVFVAAMIATFLF